MGRILESISCFIGKNHYFIGNVYKSTNPKECHKKEENNRIIVYETIIKAGSEYVWLELAKGTKYKGIPALSTSRKTKMIKAAKVICLIILEAQGEIFQGK